MSVLLHHCPLLTIEHICDDMAWELAPALASSGFFPLMFGQRANRSLLETRRCTSFFSSVKGSGPVVSTIPSDFGSGAVRQTAGVSIVGSQPYVTNFNMQLSRVSLEVCSQAVMRLRRDFGVQVRDCRTSARGIAAIRSDIPTQVMALPYAEDAIEIGCNLQATHDSDSTSTESVLNHVLQLLPPSARLLRAYVVGCTPGEALRLAEAGLQVRK
jgi:hypothetical protein